MTGPRVVIVGYGMGNVASLRNALLAIDAEVEIAEDPAAARDAERIILPGVGAFNHGMARLRQTGWHDALLEHATDRERPLLGVCLGMQLLATTGDENGPTKGLGLIAADVAKIVDRDVVVPHMGWNDTVPVRPNRLVAEPGCFYFVHSYHVVPYDPGDVTLECDHGGPIVAGLERGNLFGVQFHPEKSQIDGLALLRSFLSV